MAVKLSTIDIVIIFAYLAVVITLGMWGMGEGGW